MATRRTIRREKQRQAAADRQAAEMSRKDRERPLPPTDAETEALMAAIFGKLEEGGDVLTATKAVTTVVAAKPPCHHPAGGHCRDCGPKEARPELKVCTCDIAFGRRHAPYCAFATDRPPACACTPCPEGKHSTTCPAGEVAPAAQCDDPYEPTREAPDDHRCEPCRADATILAFAYGKWRCQSCEKAFAARLADAKVVEASGLGYCRCDDCRGTFDRVYLTDKHRCLTCHRNMFREWPGAARGKPFRPAAEPAKPACICRNSAGIPHAPNCPAHPHNAGTDDLPAAEGRKQFSEADDSVSGTYPPCVHCKVPAGAVHLEGCPNRCRCGSAVCAQEVELGFDPDDITLGPSFAPTEDSIVPPSEGSAMRWLWSVVVALLKSAVHVIGGPLSWTLWLARGWAAWSQWANVRRADKACHRQDAAASAMPPLPDGPHHAAKPYGERRIIEKAWEAAKDRHDKAQELAFRALGRRDRATMRAFRLKSLQRSWWWNAAVGKLDFVLAAVVLAFCVPSSWDGLAGTLAGVVRAMAGAAAMELVSRVGF